MLILIIDDEEDSRYMLTSFLEAEGFEVYTADTSQQGLQLTQQLSPDLVILDVRLPNLGGRDVCQRIRTFSEVPILMVSAYARDSEDVVRGLNTGADDYLPKPLNLDLLKARITALLRRSTRIAWRESRPAYVDAHLIIDLSREQVQVQGEVVSLSPLEFRLLAILVRNLNEPVPTLEIVETLWPQADPDEFMGYVHTYIKRVRAVVEPDPSTPSYIVNERGFGYRFVPQG